MALFIAPPINMLKTHSPHSPQASSAESQTSDSLHELQCWQRLQLQDEEALATLYDVHSGAVYGVLLRLLDHQTAQEVLQDVFLRLWHNPQSFDPRRASLRVYLLVMARSRALDRLRSRRQTVPLFDEEGAELSLADNSWGPQDLSEQQARRRRLEGALQALSPQQQETVRRAFFMGQSREEISKVMGVPVGTVKSRLSYALKNLRKVLGEEVTLWLD